MSWVKLDDSFHRNDKQLQMSDGAFRVYVCAMSWCAQVPDPTGYLTTAQARALVASLGKRPAVIGELVRLNAWEEAEGGYLIHDYEQYLEKGSLERVRRFRERKRAGNVTGNGANPTEPVTETPPVTESNASHARAPDGYPVPEPVVPSGLRPSGTPEPVPVHPPQPPPGESVTVLDGEFSDGYEAFLAALRRSTGRDFHADAISRSRYADRRRDGFTDAELEQAARGVAMSKFHMGLNDSSLPHNDPDAVLRSRSLRQFIGWGSGEIGIIRAETPDERRDREWNAAIERRGEMRRPELQA